MTYLKPEMEVIEYMEYIETDVITVSPGQETDGNNDGVDWG